MLIDEDPDENPAPVRPNGSGEWSPGLRPKADALGGGMTMGCGLTGRESCLAEPGSRDLPGRNDWGRVLPRASAFGLSPGLESPDPLGRMQEMAHLLRDEP